MPSSAELQFPTREECVVPDLLAARAAAEPDKLFVLFEDEQWTRADAVREAWRAGNGLQRSASRWATTSRSWMPTGPDVLRTWFGANAAGAVYAPLNLAARGSYLEHTLNLAESKVLVAHHELVERLPGSTCRTSSRSSSSAARRRSSCPGRRSRSTSCSTAPPRRGRRCRGRSSRGTTSA